MVYVQAKDKTPLMPCENVIARLLLKACKAKVVRKVPFTIRLNYETTKYVQELTLGIDTGSGELGAAVYSKNGDILYKTEDIVRNDIKEKMDQRRKFRQSRRNRKTRYRKKRFDNRGNSKRKGRISPTITSKIHSHVKEIEFVKTILPIKYLVLEIGHFDPHLLKNPALTNENIKRCGYQKGANYGYQNSRLAAFHRDNYTCQYCKDKKKKHLHAHHIVYRSNGGSDDMTNLITLCKECHISLHNGEFELKIKGNKATLKHATHMNIIASQLQKIYPDAITTYGYITHENRLLLGLDKTHAVDACVIASGGKPFRNRTDVVYVKKCVSDGDSKLARGKFSDIPIPVGKIEGFRKFDKVDYLGGIYFIKGRRQGKKGCDSTATLMDIRGNEIKFEHAQRGFKTPKLCNMKRISARKTWIIDELDTVNT